MAVPNFNDARLDALNSLGEDGTSFDSNLTGAEEACANFIDRVQSNIRAEGLVDTGRMSDLTIEKAGTKINIMGMDYIIYLDEGVQGAESNAKAPNSPFKMTKVPYSGIFKDWIIRKNIRVRNTSIMGLGSSRDDDGIDDNDIDSVAYAMAYNRYKYGSEPKNILSKEIPQLVEEAGEGVAEIWIKGLFEDIDEQYGTK